MNEKTHVEAMEAAVSMLVEERRFVAGQMADGTLGAVDGGQQILRLQEMIEAAQRALAAEQKEIPLDYVPMSVL